MRRHLPIVALVGAALAAAALSLALRAPCLAPELPPKATIWGTGCYSDLQVMWYQRGLSEHRIPYLEPISVGGRLVTVEYPVLSGMLMWLLSLTSRSFAGFVVACTLVAAISAAAISVLLYRFSGRFAWLWAVSPALVFYLSYNVDALPTLCAVAGLVMLARQDPTSVSRGRYVGAAAMLGLGGALKLYPLLFVLAMCLWLLRGRPGSGQIGLAGRWRRAVEAGMAAVAVLSLVNIPFVIGNPEGWLAPFRFQAERTIDASTLSVWFYLGKLVPGLSSSMLMGASTVATAVAIAAVAVAAWRHVGDYPLLEASLATLAAYLLLNKVFSPQYIIWILPLMILAGLRLVALLAYVLIDPVIYWGWYLGLFADEVQQPAVSSFWLVIRMMGVVLRGMVVAAIGVLTALPARPGSIWGAWRQNSDAASEYSGRERWGLDGPIVCPTAGTARRWSAVPPTRRSGETPPL